MGFLWSSLVINLSDTKVSQDGENSPTKIPLLLDQENSNSDDVYLLGIGEHPGLSLISVPLTSKNNLSWSLDIVTSLESKGKEAFIFGTLPRPKFEELDYVR